MNTQSTGFHIQQDGYKKLFTPIGNEFDKYKTFDQKVQPTFDLTDLNDIF